MPDTSSTTTQTTTTQTTSTSSDNSTIEGCLNGSAGNYTLTDTSGKSWQLSGDTSKLSDHVGHQVRVTGSEASASSGMGGTAGTTGTTGTTGTSGTSGTTGTAGATGTTNPSGGTNPSGSISGGAGAACSSQGNFNVSKVKMISSTCSTTSK